MKFSILFLLFVQLAFAQDPALVKGQQIAKDVEASQNGFSSESSKLEMHLINAYGEVIKREMISKTIEGKGNEGDKSLIEFIFPLDVKGTQLLTWSHKDKSDDQWLYLPAFKRVKRIASSVKSGSFMSSEFSYEDFGGQNIDKYTFKYLKDETIDKTLCWVVERTPKESDSGYSKQVVWFDQKRKIAIKVDYYDRKNELLKTGIFSDHQQIKGFWRSMKIEMNNVQTRKKSLLFWSARKVGEKISEDIFQPNRLK